MAHSDSDTMTAKQKRNAADRARYAAKKASAKPTGPITSVNTPVRKVMDMIHVSNIRGTKDEKEGFYVCDIDLGAATIYGALLDGKIGSLQTPRFNGQRATRLKPRFACHVRMAAIEAVERHITKKNGAVWTFPDKEKWLCSKSPKGAS